MAYATNITFPVFTVGEDTIQLKMQFVHTGAGSDIELNSWDKNLFVGDYGSRECFYDLEDALLVPSNCRMMIYDMDGVIAEIMFGEGALSVNTPDKKSGIYKFVNGALAYQAYIVEDSISYNMGTKEFTFEASPKIDILNKTAIYNDSGVTINSCGLSTGTYYLLYDVIEKLFQSVNPSISYDTSLKIDQDWIFKGNRISLGTRLDSIYSSEIMIDVTPLFFNNSYGIANYADVLKKLAIDFGCYTGMVSTGRAFFKKLFKYNASDAQAVKVIGWTKEYKYGLIDYVKVTTGISSPYEPYEIGTYTKVAERRIDKKSLPGFWRSDSASATNIRASVSREDYWLFDHGSAITPFPSLGAVYEEAGGSSRQYTVVGVPYAGATNETQTIIMRQTTFTSTSPASTGTLNKMGGSGVASISYSSVIDASGDFYIYKSKDVDAVGDVFYDHGEMLTRFWYNWRNTVTKCRVDRFTLLGINYDFLKSFNYSGGKYQIISMKNYDAKGTTEIDALYLGEL